MTKSTSMLGIVGAVSGSGVSVQLAESVSSGIMIIGGRSYKIGQVGNFVRIPQGYHELYGMISEVGASARPDNDQETKNRGDRWMKVQLVGEIAGASFERGISQFPSINDEVHLVTENDLVRVYGGSKDGQINVGRLANAESIPVTIDLDKLVTRHSALLGSTGSGKSTSVASLLRSICVDKENSYPSARVLLIDIHGEYSSALADISKVYRALPNDDELQLQIPYWALPPSEMISFLMGGVDDRQSTAILEKIFAAKQAYAIAQSPDGINPVSMTVETPLPYCLKTLWYELLDTEVKTWNEKEQLNPAIIAPGNAQTLTPPTYRPAGNGGAAPFLNKVGVLSLKRQLQKMRSKLLDTQYDFLLNPGEWSPDENGVTINELPDLVQDWIGHDKPITVLDLSGVPSGILLDMIDGILSIIYEALFWGRERPEGGRQRPQLIVMEEAHRYLGKESKNAARNIVQRIVKEGRKFGVGAMIVSQRPSEVDETILSQCGTFVSLRLTNSGDRSKVQASLPDNLSAIAGSLPVLRTGEAIITGEATSLPVRCRLRLPKKEHRPNSEDPEVALKWREKRGAEDYNSLIASWRSQNTKWAPEEPAQEEE